MSRAFRWDQAAKPHVGYGVDSPIPENTLELFSLLWIVMEGGRGT